MQLLHVIELRESIWSPTTQSEFWLSISQLIIDAPDHFIICMYDTCP